MKLEEIEEHIANDGGLYRSLVTLRGGCSCHLSPPCYACSEPLTEAEAEELGFEITTDAPQVDYMAAVRESCK